MNKPLKHSKDRMAGSVEKKALKLCKMHRDCSPRKEEIERGAVKKVFQGKVNKIYFLVCQEKLLAKCNEILQCERKVTSF